MRTDDELTKREVDPDGEAYDDNLHDKEEPDDKAPGEEVDPDSTKVDPDGTEVFDDEEEHRREPF